MFSGASKVLAEGIGAADNCSIYFGHSTIQGTSEYQQFLLPDEQPQILLKCTKGEYIFTDCGLTVVFGETAAGRKREVRRYDYRENHILDISFETAGLSDFDCQINFLVGTKEFTIDIKKAEQENGAKLYRILHSVAVVQEAETRYFTLASNAFTAALGSSLTSDPSGLPNLIGISMQGADAICNRYNRRSYRDIFEMHIQH